MIIELYDWNDGGKDSMKYRKILMWGCFLMVCLLTACQQGDSERIEATSTTEVFAKTPEVTQESAREIRTEQEMTTTMEASQTIPETILETGDMAETDKVGENSETDQEKFTWLDYALAEGLGKEPGELTEEDYLSMEWLEVHGGDIQKTPRFSQNNVVRFKISENKSVFVVPLQNSPHDMIDIRDIVKCGNLKRLEFVLNYTPRPETYIIHYDELRQLKQLESLDIRLNESDPFSPAIADKIDDLSFVYDMPNLKEIVLENIDLPDDLSVLFSHHFWFIRLYGCNITESDFSNLDSDVFYPVYLLLGYNQIKDATIITAMQRKMMDGTGNAIYQLDLSNNPLKKIGECMTFEWLEQYGRDLGDVSLDFSGTNFAECSFDWYATAH